MVLIFLFWRIQTAQVQSITDQESRLRHELREKVQEFDGYKSQTDAEKFKAQARLSELEIRCAEFERQNQLLQTSSNSLLQDTIRTSSQWQNEVGGYQETIRSLELSIKQLGNQNEELQSQNQKLNLQLKSMTSITDITPKEEKTFSTRMATPEDQLRRSREVPAPPPPLQAAGFPPGLPSFGEVSDLVDESGSRKAAVDRQLLGSEGAAGDLQRPEELSRIKSNKKIIGTLLSNSLVYSNNLPTRATLLKKSALDHYEQSEYHDVPIVSILKSRLIDCLFDRPTPGEPFLPTSLFGHPIQTSKSMIERNERPMVARVLSRVSNLWDLGEDLRLALVQVDPSLSDRYLESKTSSGTK